MCGLHFWVCGASVVQVVVQGFAVRPLITVATTLLQVIEYVTGLQNEITDISTKEDTYADYQELFGLEVTKIEEVYLSPRAILLCSLSLQAPVPIRV